jgi:hypothetical protein
LTCKTCTKTCAEVLAVNSQVNPYRIGAKGNWRPAEAYALYSKRTPNFVANHNALRNQGSIPNFENFWLWDNGQWNPNLTSSKWVKTNTITHYDQKGNEVETRDALQVYSSALYRYKNTLAAAVSANARMRETAFDGFEDYSFLDPNDNCYAEHWNFAHNQTARITNEKAHTGNYAFKVGSNETFVKSVPIHVPAIQQQDSEIAPTEANVLKRTFPAFGIQEGKYLISAWVSKAGDCKPNDLSPITLKINGNAYTFQPKGAIIEGWQRVEGVFSVNAAATQFSVEIFNGTNTNAYIDDIRILPFNAKMKSFAYDARTLRLMAQLDENNYATFYEYDDEGSLIRTKRETERGIVTLQENRNFLRPSN